MPQELKVEMLNALRKLSSEQSWFYGHKSAVDRCLKKSAGKQLPADLAQAHILRPLDKRGYIEAWFWGDIGGWSRQPTPLTVVKSNIRGSGWQDILDSYPEKPDMALELSVSESGRAVLDAERTPREGL